jgi:hypothetical protein
MSSKDASAANGGSTPRVQVFADTDDGYVDHTDRAMGLGEPRPLTLDAMRRHHEEGQQSMPGDGMSPG